MEMQAREALECCKESLMGDSLWSSEDGDSDRNGKSKDEAQKISVGNKDSIGTWTSGCVATSGRKVVCIFPVSGDLQETKNKGGSVIWQRKFPDSPVYVLLAALTLIYNDDWGQKGTKRI